jgi:hypothetical protein
MDELIEKLNLYGNIEVLKDEFVFTLLITSRVNGWALTTGQVPLKILELVTNYLGDTKPIIEVVKNEKDFILIVLKPKVAQ